MTNKGQLESFFVFIITLFLILFCITYYFYFKTGTIPVFTPEREIRPSEKSLLPPGTLFPKEKQSPYIKEKQLPYIFSLNIAKAETNLKPNKNLDTFIISAPPIVLEDNIAKFSFSGKNYRKPFEKLRFQTFLYPIDKKWQTTYGTEKIYYLPKFPAFYIFYVRSINNENYDPTPATYYFLTRISPYYKNISITPSYDGYSLIIRNSSNSDINVTNWYVKTSIFLYRIPKAVKYFHLNKNKNIEEDIILKRGDILKIISVYSSATSAPPSLPYNKIQLSPFGQNFLGNKCFVYLNKIYQNLNYPSYYCDKFSSKEILDMRLNLEISEACAKYISTLGCTPSLASIKNAPDNRCQSLIEDRFNYNSCFERHKDDKDFLGKEWRIYIDTRDKYDIENRKELQKIHSTRFEIINLYDANGLIVDRYYIY